MRAVFLSLIPCIFSGVIASHAADIPQTGTPVLIELFTSEGCSSCPPADAWLQRIDTSQPLPGVDMIVLSEHVTYWNHDGWKDPYSQDLFTDRQNDYVKALGLSTPYTPQLIADGKSELHLNDPQQTKEILLRAASQQKVPTRISELRVDKSAGTILRAHIEVDGTQLTHNAEVFAVVALDHASTQVTQGENKGRSLSHVAVAQEFEKIGRLEKQKVFNKDIDIKLTPTMGSQTLRLVVFIQDPGFGRVVGAAFARTSISDGK